MSGEPATLGVAFESESAWNISLDDDAGGVVHLSSIIAGLSAAQDLFLDSCISVCLPTLIVHVDKGLALGGLEVTNIA